MLLFVSASNWSFTGILVRIVFDIVLFPGEFNFQLKSTKAMVKKMIVNGEWHDETFTTCYISPPKHSLNLILLELKVSWVAVGCSIIHNAVKKVSQ